MRGIGSFQWKALRPSGAVLAVAAGLIVGAGASGCARESAEDVVTRTLEHRAGTPIRVETRNGRIVLRPGTVGKVMVRATRRAKASSKKRARALLKKIHLELVSGPGGVRISAEHPSGSLREQYGVTFEVTVPPGASVTAESRNGAIRAHGLRGGLRASTRNGSVHAMAVAGAVTLSTKNGSIRLQGRVSRFDLSTKNGSIRLELLGARSLSGSSRAETVNGSITVVAPAGLAARISATTTHGRVHSALPLSSGGPARVRLSAVNGSVRVSKR